jgi:hypothetical protein
MSNYAITIAPDEVGHEYQVVLRGPGLDADGRRYVFATTHRCAAFVEAVNFAYQQGRRDAQRRTRSYEGRFLVVTGATPESLAIRPEAWWPRLKRLLGF